MLKKQETGRSMIEMLGVLAIIGVLSVGGIAGYTSAMNKHRANELLHQVSMRSVSCMAQLAQGNTTLSIADFGNYDGYSFTASYDTTNKTYSITISGKEISTAVCNNIENTRPSDVGFASSGCGTSDATVTLTYADETGTSGGSQEQMPPEVDKCANVTCSGECQKCDSDTGACVNDSTKCSSGQTCVSGNCIDSDKYQVSPPFGDCPSNTHRATLADIQADFTIENNRLVDWNWPAEENYYCAALDSYSVSNDWTDEPTDASSCPSHTIGVDSSGNISADEYDLCESSPSCSAWLCIKN